MYFTRKERALVRTHFKFLLHKDATVVEIPIISNNVSPIANPGIINNIIDNIVKIIPQIAVRIHAILLTVFILNSSFRNISHKI